MNELERLLAECSPEQQRELARLTDRPDPTPPTADPAVLRRLDRTEAPLSYAQQRLWFLHELRPDDTAYNVCHRIDWPAAVDHQVLATALGDLVGRHEILRTRFPAVDGEPRQVIDPPSPVPLPLVDLTGLPGDRAASARDRIAAEAANEPFDLATGPVLRAVLLRHRTADHSLLLTLHHIVCDGWSVDMLVDELTTAYQARLSGDPPPHAVSDLQYADFAAWQRTWLGAGELDDQLGYWRARLAGGAEPMALPVDHPRMPGRRPRGAVIRWRVPNDVRDAVLGLGREHGTTTFMTLLAGFQLLLSRYTDQPVVTVTTPVTNRSLPELEGLLGMFLNTLVLRADIGTAPTFAALLARTRDDVLADFAHQDVPFERLVEELAPSRDLGQIPFSPVMFALRTVRTHRTDTGTVLDVVEIHPDAARNDLVLVAEAGPESLTFVYEYDRNLFEPETIERLHGHLLQLLTAAARAPDRPLAELTMLTQDELAALAAWNDTATPYPLAVGVTELIDRQAELTPDATALVFAFSVSRAAQTISYAQLAARTNQLAHHLRGIGIEPGSRVGVYLPRSTDLVIALLAVLKAGHTYVPLDPSYPTDRLAFIISDARCAAVISRPDIAGELVGEGGPILVDPATAGIGAETTDAPPPGRDPAAVAYVLYTSGSTGVPKGAVNTHGGLTNHTLWMRDAFSVTADDTVVQKTPIGFDVSLWELLVPLTAGARLVLASPDGHRDPQYLADLIAEHRVTMIHFVPSMLQAFLETADLGACASVRQVICSGEAFPAEVQRLFFAAGLRARLDNLYGPTEAAIHVTRRTCTHGDAGGASIGWPVANTQCHVLDRHGRPLPVGLVGELYLGGVQVARGYLNRPDLTEAAFRPDPFGGRPDGLLYRTGDLVRRRPDGSLDYLGRRDNQVKLRGFRIELGEIEAALAAHEAVREAVVVLATAGSGEPALVAYVTLATGAAAPVAELRAALARSLPSYMIPQDFVTLDALPLLPNGKVDRRGLAARAPDPDPVVDAAVTEPRDDIEHTIAQLFAELLGRPRVGIRDSFLDIGGHSLLATRLAARIRRKFDVDLPLRTVFDSPTVELLAIAVVEQVMSQLDPAELAELAASAGDPDDTGDV
jgi:amino acid adenylation domain-containing protein